MIMIGRSHSSNLDTYAKKRDFTATPEPAASLKDRAGPLFYVIHEHAARNLHYDLRLELDGVLKSWAVPHGLLIKPGEKHLAVQTEDHPIDYASFEGVIPPKQYGAGKVIVWDCGVYSPDTGGSYSFHDRATGQARVRDALEEGKLSFTFAGTKLKGSFALIRTAKGWLLIKHSDGIGPVDIELERSPLSGETVTAVTASVPRLLLTQMVPSEPQEPTPTKIAVMTAQTAEQAFSHPEWLFEPKLDGYRMTAYLNNGNVKLLSRGGIDYTKYFPNIVKELARQPVQPAVLDGEIIAFENGRPSFSALQEITKFVLVDDKAHSCVFYCFDILHAVGVNTRHAAYLDRRRFLKQCVTQSDHVKIVHAEQDGLALYQAAIETGLEGVMAKKKSSVYSVGARSPNWLKVKPIRTAEFVIVGYTKGNRGSLGALLLGYWDKGTLQYVGRVGTGFDTRTISMLLGRLQPLTTKNSLLPDKAVRAALWVKPELVAEVSYFELTKENKLRHPVFVKLREDVDPRMVSLPSAKPVSPPGRSEVDADEIAQLLKQLGESDAKCILKVGGHQIVLTQLDKVMWPAHKKYKALTKRDLIHYLMSVSPYMLPHLRNRPVTLIRMPDGIGGESFFQKHLDQKLPLFMETVAEPSKAKTAKPLLLCNNLASLIWLGNLG
ncbi:non-homologous end-joining DNA ligase, partial [Undibacterium arcticum]